MSYAAALSQGKAKGQVPRATPQIVKRGDNGQASGEQGAKAVPQKKKRSSKKKKTPSNTAAVVISQPLVAEGVQSVSLADVVAEATSKIDLGALEIDYLKPRRAATGGLILEIPGGNGEGKADSLAQKLMEVVGDRPRLSRPSRKQEIRVSGRVGHTIRSGGGCGKGWWMPGGGYTGR